MLGDWVDDKSVKFSNFNTERASVWGMIAVFSYLFHTWEQQSVGKEKRLKGF